jgi:hypothetical protein
MSELAFNLAGEPFEVPGVAVGWRVRKLKRKGAPEVVYSRDGIPLTLPIDADMEDLRDDLRHEAHPEGRYRLDPLDDHNRMIPNAPAGYVYLHSAEPVVQPAPVPAAPPVPLGSDQAVIEAMRMNTELARTIIERFPAMLDSAAGLLRAADGAGMPARTPRALPEPIEVEDKLEDELEDELETEAEVVPKASGWASLLEALIPVVAPAIVNAITSGKVSFPGGLGALLDCRRASPKASAAAATRAATTPIVTSAPSPRDPMQTSATATRAASTPVVTPAPGPRDPAPARRGSSTIREATASMELADTPEARHSTTATPESTPREATTCEAHAPANTAESPAETSAELPTLDPATIAHFVAIQGALTLQESMLARALAAELSSAERNRWLAELRTLSVPEAVARIRAILGIDGDDTAGGMS